MSTGGREGNVRAVVGRSHLPALATLGKSGAGAGLSSIHAGLGVGLSTTLRTEQDAGLFLSSKRCWRAEQRRTALPGTRLEQWEMEQVLCSFTHSCTTTMPEFLLSVAIAMSPWSRKTPVAGQAATFPSVTPMQS